MCLSSTCCFSRPLQRVLCRLLRFLEALLAHHLALLFSLLVVHFAVGSCRHFVRLEILAQIGAVKVYEVFEVECSSRHDSSGQHLLHNYILVVYAR